MTKALIFVSIFIMAIIFISQTTIGNIPEGKIYRNQNIEKPWLKVSPPPRVEGNLIKKYYQKIHMLYQDDLEIYVVAYEEKPNYLLAKIDSDGVYTNIYLTQRSNIQGTAFEKMWDLTINIWRHDFKIKKKILEQVIICSEKIDKIKAVSYDYMVYEHDNSVRLKTIPVPEKDFPELEKIFQKFYSFMFAQCNGNLWL